MGQYNSKGALFIDLDGTVFKHGTGEPIGEGVEAIKTLNEEGYKIFFTTYRGSENFPNGTKYGEDTTLRQLSDLNIPYEQIIWNVSSPRVLINDDGVGQLRVQTNKGFKLEQVLEVLKNCK